MNCIIEPDSEGKGGIYLGNVTSASDKESLQTNKISAILTAANGINLKYPKEYQHKVLLAEDMPNFDISQFFEESIIWIEEQRKNTNVLIHCMAGVSRSAAIAMAYCIIKFNWTYDNTFQIFQKKRSVVFPNAGFVKQLKFFEQNNNENQQTIQSIISKYKKEEN